MKTTAAVAVIAAMFAQGSASASEFAMTFEAHGFYDIHGNVAAPYSSVSGSVSWIANSQTSGIQALTGLNLTIGTHSYALNEVTFINGGATTSVIGGLLSDANGISEASQDFVLTFDRAGQFYNFFYTQPGAPTTWLTQELGSVSISAVPELPSAVLLSAGLLTAGVAAARRRRG